MLRAVDSSSGNQFFPFNFFFFWLFKKRRLLSERFLINSSFLCTSNVSLTLDFDRSPLQQIIPKIFQFRIVIIFRSIVHPLSINIFQICVHVSINHRVRKRLQFLLSPFEAIKDVSDLHYIKLRSIVQ